MKNTPVTLLWSVESDSGYTYHPKRDIWVAWNQDTAKRVDKPDGFEVNWYGDGVSVKTVQNF